MKKFKEIIGKMIDKTGFANTWLTPDEILQGSFIYKTGDKKYKINLPVITSGKLHKLRIVTKHNENSIEKIIRVRYNKGKTVAKNCWIGKNSLTQSYETVIRVGNRVIKFKVDENANQTYKQKLCSLGILPKISLFSIFRKKYRGDVIVKFHTYDDTLKVFVPKYESLSNTDLLDEKLGKSKINSLVKSNSNLFDPKKSLENKIDNEELVRQFNIYGVKGVFKTIKNHVLKGVKVKFSINPGLIEPGVCKSVIKTTTCYGPYSALPTVSKEFTKFHIEINPSYIHNPFVAAAVISHELCHVINNRYLNSHYGSGFAFSSFSEYSKYSNFDKTDEEKTVEVLTIINGLGEYQLRACTFGYIMGYFSPKVFLRLNDYLNTYIK